MYAGRAYRSQGYPCTLSISSGTRDAALPAGVQESRGRIGSDEAASTSPALDGVSVR
jgi:hypothetical protein